MTTFVSNWSGAGIDDNGDILKYLKGYVNNGDGTETLFYKHTMPDIDMEAGDVLSVNWSISVDAPLECEITRIDPEYVPPPAPTIEEIIEGHARKSPLRELLIREGFIDDCDPVEVQGCDHCNQCR